MTPLPIETFHCPECTALLLPTTCCCGRAHPHWLRCPDCGAQFQATVQRGHVTLLLTWSVAADAEGAP